mgnify:CR=1 FL=1
MMTTLLGYLAMVFIGISFLMKEVRTLRMFNLIGASLFVIWGVLISEPPVYILNTFIVLVNIYYIFLVPKEKK